MIQTSMRANEVEKEDKNRNSSISRVKRMKATFGFIPSLETVVKSFDKIVANIVLKALDTNVFSMRKVALSRNLVGTIAIANNGIGMT